ncbi:RagB/SusD family nutrient uptake outer membrane protein [Epilithonimonas sp.]|uniref:RagB/SusD family nutrient uptake outer membrane protein n=1 Tax=Epilithonimonas sp. TaxID=2894511 RepID=UPI002FDCA8FD
MKKYFYIIASFFLLSAANACSEKELDLFPPSSDDIQDINTEDKLQKFLNGGYLSLASVNAFGTDILAFGDVLSDHLYVTNAKAYVLTTNMNYNALNNDFGFYGTLYDAIMSCNMVINNTQVAETENVKRIKAEAKILRGFAYFTLVNYYSPTPTSGINQEYGVPLVLGNYDASIQPARATVQEVYNQVISDLTAGANGAQDTPMLDGKASKVTFSKRAAKLLLSRVYLTRRAPGDAQLALQYASDIVNSQNEDYAPIASGVYQTYFSGTNEATSENQPETIWELDVTTSTNVVTGLGANKALPTLYNRLSGDRRALLFTRNFYDSFPSTDVRKGPAATGLLTTTGVPATDNPVGVWTNKYPRLTGDGNFMRNIKILRFAEAQLNRIEALYLTGQNSTALTELNMFAASRNGSTYTGANLLNDILTEKGKEFYGEGQRFLDLKRHNLALVKNSNCVMNCNVPASDKLFVLPISQNALNYNMNLKQYPGY